MKPAAYVWMLLVGLSTVALGHHTGSDHNDTRLVASTVTNFGFNVLKQLARDSRNLALSPLRIATSLLGVSLGARSTTRTQILEGLGFNVSEIPEKKIHEGFHDAILGLSRTSDQIQIDQGQALFLRENVTFKQTFLDDVHASYDAYLTSAKFQEPKEAEKQINDYVERKTGGKISQVVKDLDPDTELAAISYISFRGRWKKPFNPLLTKEEDFFVDENTTIKVPMMFGTGWFDTYFDVERSCTVLRLDYNSSASALFVLPEPGKDKQLEEALTSDTLTEWQRRVQRGVADVYLPIFKVSTSHYLEEFLRNQHIIDVFSDSADLSGITETIPLKLSKVTHKAVLSIDERGTTASAVPVEEAVPMAMLPKIVFNRPFLMLIQMEGRVVLTGNIRDPRML